MIARSVVAIVLMIGFYLLGLTIGFGLLYIPYVTLMNGDHLDIRLALICILGGLAILWSLVPRVDRFLAPGPRLDAADQPRLFERLRKLALSVKQEMPKEVYLVPEMNAFSDSRL